MASYDATYDWPQPRRRLRRWLARFIALVALVACGAGLYAIGHDAFRSDPDQQQRVYQLAQQRITEAARSSGLDDRAKANTEKMLQSLFSRLGYQKVAVTYDTP